ncbi:hypothetical protein V1457_08470 [Saccharopolyspora sp. SCSIO 74807]|nr:MULTISPECIES: hypothetical protein [unclassified Saccharopolyspora]
MTDRAGLAPEVDVQAPGEGGALGHARKVRSSAMDRQRGPSQ